ncbi:MAG: nuclear transport factor 2 family protein [Novosphingobium sp.]|nr:nuclear transport factor 2 family protein [Novosphingobium sp.]
MPDPRLAQSHALARAYFAAVTAGELPDDLLTPDMTAWTTTQGTLSKAMYQQMIRLLRRMCAEPLRFTIDAITAEDDRVVAEARSVGTLIDGSAYANTYVFAFRIREGRIASIAEHFNPLVVQEKLYPVMRLLNEGGK